MQPENKNLKGFCDLKQLEHLILKPTCYKGKTPSTIDLIITNHKTSFMKSDTCETGLLDHHEMTYSFLRKPLPKENLKQFNIGVLTTLIRRSLMINYKKEFELIYPLKQFLKSFNLL